MSEPDDSVPPRSDASPSESASPSGHNAVRTEVAPDGSRRHFLKVVGIGTCAMGVTAAALGPGLALVGYPFSHETTRGGRGFLPAGKLSRFKDGVPTKVDFFDDKIDAWNRIEHVKVGSAWVLRQDDNVVALSTVCPHVGCAIEYDEDHHKFYCPCHRSFFALDGACEDGPSPRALDELEVEEKEGVLQVRYARFRQGTSDKVEI